MRNWYYFNWLCGDHIVEQHIHNIDVMNWAFGGPPEKANAMGGRQVRTGPEYGHIFDHFAVEYVYPGGVRTLSECRQIDGCWNRVSEKIIGTKGVANPSGRITGEKNWSAPGGGRNACVQEHADLIASIRANEPLNRDLVDTIVRQVPAGNPVNRRIKMCTRVLAAGKIVPFPGRTTVIVGRDLLHAEPGTLTEFRWQDDHGKIRIQRVGEIDRRDFAIGHG